MAYYIRNPERYQMIRWLGNKADLKQFLDIKYEVCQNQTLRVHFDDKFVDVPLGYWLRKPVNMQAYVCITPEEAQNYSLQEN